MIDYIKLIQRRHPGYQELKTLSDFYESTYNGGRSWFSKNIYKYIKEGEEYYNQRLNRAYRFNHTKEIVDSVTKYIFKGKISRSDDAPEYIKNFWNKTTFQGRNIEGLAQSMDRKSSIFGRVYVVVDSTSDGEIINVEDETDKNFRTYAYVVQPQDVLDFSYDEFGELNWILFYEPYRDDTDPFASSNDFINQYKLWTKTNWHQIRIKAPNQNMTELTTLPSNEIEVTTGEHKLGVVPVVPVDCVQSDSEIGATSMISEISFLDRAIANYLSNLDVIIQDQTFSQLIVPEQSVPQGDDGYSKVVEMGTQSIFTYDGQGGMKPEYISPDPKQAQVLLAVINKIIHEIYNTVGMSSERTKQDNAVGIDNSSGVAKAYDFEKINTLLACKANNLENAENKICTLVAKWNGKELPNEQMVIYPDNFDVKDLYDEFEIASQLSLLDSPFDVRREQMKIVIEKLFPQIKESLRNKMIENLKDWPVMPVITTESLSMPEGKNAKGSISYSDSQGKANQQIAASASGKRQGQVTQDTK